MIAFIILVICWTRLHEFISLILWVIAEVLVPEGAESPKSRRQVDSKMIRGKSIVSAEVPDPEAFVDAKKLLRMEVKRDIPESVVEKGEHRGRSLCRTKRFYKRPTISPVGGHTNNSLSMTGTKGTPTAKEKSVEEIPLSTNPEKEKPMDGGAPNSFSNVNLDKRLSWNVRRAPRHKHVMTLSDIPEEASSSLANDHENTTQRRNAKNVVSGDLFPLQASSPRRSLARVKRRASYLQKHEEVKACVSNAAARLGKIWAPDSRYRRCLKGRKRVEKAFQNSLDKLKSFRKEEAEV